MALQTLADELGIAEGWARPTPASRCVCKQPIVVARTEAGADITLDGHPDGGPLRVTDGTWDQVATTADVTGRRALVIAESTPHGQHRTHTCTGVPRRRTGR